MKATMLIIVGNLASGKSTLINNIKPNFPKAEFFSIDEYRTKFESNTAEKDALAWKTLIEDVKNLHFVILECSGASKYFPLLKSRYRGRVITILIDIPIHVSVIRAKRRENELQISKKYTILQSVKYIDEKIKELTIDAVVNGDQSEKSLVTDFLNLFSKPK